MVRSFVILELPGLLLSAHETRPPAVTVTSTDQIDPLPDAGLTAAGAVDSTPSDESVVVRTGWRRVLVHTRDAPHELLDRLWTDPDELLATGDMIKDGDRSTVVQVSVDGQRFVIKRYNLRGPLHTMSHWFLRSRARWSWLNGRRLRAGGLRSPRPLAFVEERVGPCRMRSFLVNCHHPGQTLLALVHDGGIAGDRLVRIASRFGELWRGLDRLQLGHGDMKATNFIVDDHDDVWMVDLDAMRTYRRGPMLAARRRSDLDRFMRNWQETPHAAAAFRDAIDTADARGE